MHYLPKNGINCATSWLRILFCSALWGTQDQKSGNIVLHHNLYLFILYLASHQLYALMKENVKWSEYDNRERNSFGAHFDGNCKTIPLRATDLFLHWISQFPPICQEENTFCQEEIYDNCEGSIFILCWIETKVALTRKWWYQNGNKFWQMGKVQMEIKEGIQEKTRSIRDRFNSGSQKPQQEFFRITF